MISFAKQGYTHIDFRTYDTDWDSEAYMSVSGQNSNNSVRVNDAFLNAVADDDDWDLKRRKDGKLHKRMRARELWEQISHAAWACADPGIQFHTTVNDWHTCPKGGEIRASNPCSEYMFLDDTACNLASLNLMTFRKDGEDGVKQFDTAAFEHAVRLWTIVLEISVLMAQFPSKEIADALLRVPHARARLRQYRRASDGGGHSLRFARGPRDRGRDHRDPDRRVLCDVGRDGGRARHLPALRRQPRRDAARDPQSPPRRASARRAGYESLSTPPVPLDHAAIANKALSEAAKSAWNQALSLGTAYGFRNAQATVIAPTGTIGLLMDCDTTGVEPDFALVKFKKLAGGGYFKIINRCVPEALKTLGYGEDQIDDIVLYAVGHGTLAGCNALSHGALRAKGFGDARDRGGRAARSSRPSTSASCSTNGRSAKSSASARWASIAAAARRSPTSTC